MNHWAYLSPGRVSCPTCGAEPNELCMMFDPYCRVWVANPHYHVEREAKYRATDLPLQLTLPIDGATL